MSLCASPTAKSGAQESRGLEKGQVVDPVAFLQHAWPTLAVAAAVVFLSGALRGLTGFGFAIAAVPLMSLFMAPRLAVVIAQVLPLAFAAVDAPQAWRHAQKTALPRLLLGALLATPIGLLALRFLPLEAQRLMIAAAAFVALVVVWLGPRAHSPALAARPAAVGVAAGLLNGLAAMPGPPVVMYFLTAHIPVVSARASLIVFFAGTAIIGTVSSVALGLVDAQSLAFIVILAPVMLLGNHIGRELFHAGDEALYRRAALAILAASALSAAWRGLAGFL